MEILWTFFSRGIQPLHRWEVNARMRPRRSCPDRPFSVELGNMGINTRILGGIHSALQGGSPYLKM
jgi:hypothetical protein